MSSLAGPARARRAWSGVIAPNRRPGSPAPEGGLAFLDPPAAASGQADWHVRMLDAHAVEVVHFHPVAHRWARWHVSRAPDTPCLGTIQSLHAVTRKEGEERARALSSPSSGPWRPRSRD